MSFPLRFGKGKGLIWIKLGNWRILRVKDVRRSDYVLFSDAYSSYHIGPFSVQIFGFPRFWRNKSAVWANERASRLRRWKKEEEIK